MWPIPKGEEKEAMSSVKMSKSKPETCVFIYDSPAEIKQKMCKAFCPERTVAFNPVLEFCKYIIFREKHVHYKQAGEVRWKRWVPELPRTGAYVRRGKLHPQDLKNAVAEELALILEPVRRYFDTHKEAKECLETVKVAKITR